MELGLSVEMEISGRPLVIDIMWGWEVLGDSMSSTRLSHLRGSGLTPGQSTENVSATQQQLCPSLRLLDHGLLAAAEPISCFHLW